MAARMTFGAMLREARERRGIDLATAARQLRIRPDILRSIEESDFARMPSSGYARNMVHAYARLVGLDPTEMTRRYLDEAYAYQVGCARSETRSMGRGQAGSSSRQSARCRQGQTRAEEQRDDPPPRQNAFGRTMYDDRTDVTGRTYAHDRMHPSRHTAVPGTQYTNFYAAPRIPGQGRAKLPFIIAAAVVLVVFIVVLVLVFGGKSEPEQEVPNVPITGLTDTSNPVEEGDGASSAADAVQPEQPVVVAPEKVVFSFSVASGDEAYIEVYEDSDTPSIAEDVVGPVEKNFDVTSSLKFVTSNPENVSLSLDGEQVPSDQLDDVGGGVYTYTVDFAAYLKQWKEENDPESSSNQAE